MTLYTNSIFPTLTKYIKIKNNDLNVISGANTLASLPLCDFKAEYEQYQRLSIQIPAGQTDFTLSFPTLGIKPTFLAIKVKYCTADPTKKYLKWKFSSSSDPKISFTSLLILTGTTNNPITNIVLDNPDTTSPVYLEILVSAVENDLLSDVSLSSYLNNLEFTNIHTLNELATGILALFNSDDELATTIDISDIFNIYRVIGQNRLVIDDQGNEDIVLDFLTEYDTLQALSAINWVMNDPSTRALPKAPDLVAPVITYKPIVIVDTITIDLLTYPIDTFTKQNFIDDVILTIVDDTDDTVSITINNIKFKDDNNFELNTISNAGLYTAEITISDIAGNITNETINIIAQLVNVDVTGPVITTSSNVTGLVLDPISLAAYSGIFTKNDARIYAILSVVDDFDGVIPLSSVVVDILDPLLVSTNTITGIGTYTLTFTVSDSALNDTVLVLTMLVNP